MLITGPEICSCLTCKHEQCRRDGRCYGIVWREEHAQAHLQARVADLVEDAARWGFVVTIEQRPLLPLAMGNYETVCMVREARNG